MTTLAFIMFDGAGGAAGGWAAGRLYQVRKNTFVNFKLHYESSTLILCKELSSTLLCESVCLSGIGNTCPNLYFLQYIKA